MSDEARLARAREIVERVRLLDIEGALALAIYCNEPATEGVVGRPCGRYPGHFGPCASYALGGGMDHTNYRELLSQEPPS